MKSELISCKQFQNFLTSQEPVYDREILKDVRPTTGDLVGYYITGKFDAYTGVQHSFDRFNHVFPNLTAPWNAVTSGNCVGTPCDPVENKIGWGWTRNQYGLETQSWGTHILCFDDIMTKTKAKEHFRQIIDDILRPSTTWILTHWIMQKVAELADHKWVANSTMSPFTFTWDPGGYIFMTTTAEPTSRLTPNMLRSRIRRQHFLGAIQANKEGFDHLELHTDVDTFHDLAREDPFLKTAWRFGEFTAAAKEFWKYGFSGYVADFMVKCLQFPIRFNRVSANRFQMVLPYKNVAADEGIKSEFNEDYDKAQYQWSFINNRRAIRILPFSPEALNSTMPFLVRDYGGKWKWAMNDLGADAAGRPIDNSRGNKGKFIADYKLAAKPEHTEWLELIFHMVDKPCVVELPVCNDYPGYPVQTYDSDGDPDCSCPSEIAFVAIANGAGTYEIDANSILVNGVVQTHGAVSGATLAAFVADLGVKWTAASLVGTWSVVDLATRRIKLAFTAAEVAAESVELPFVL